MNCNEKVTIRNERVEREEDERIKKNKSTIARVYVRDLSRASQIEMSFN